MHLGNGVKPASSPEERVLDEQIGFLLRQAIKRHSTIFVTLIGKDLTPTQWVVLARLDQIGAVSQNLLGRLTAMDATTIKGVVARLLRQGFVSTAPDPEDGRRLVVDLTGDGKTLVCSTKVRAVKLSEEMLAPLRAAERKQLLALLSRIR